MTASLVDVPAVSRSYELKRWSITLSSPEGVSVATRMRMSGALAKPVTDSHGIDCSSPPKHDSIRSKCSRGYKRSVHDIRNYS